MEPCVGDIVKVKDFIGTVVSGAFDFEDGTMYLVSSLEVPIPWWYLRKEMTLIDTNENEG